jgi:hypothetical protein
MLNKKRRTEIPTLVAAEVLFRSDRTCCVCNDHSKPVQIHHIDGHPSNSATDNLAVLCFDCHHKTQTYGGFARGLDAAQIRLYRGDWLGRVAVRRGALPATPIDSTEGRLLRYLQLRESSDQYSYSFEADYVLVGTSDTVADSETNLFINAFITRQLQRFRAIAIAKEATKLEMKKSHPAMALDSLAISHEVSLFDDHVLSVELQVWTYYAGAAHPNRNTSTLNFGLSPSMELQLADMFDRNSDYIEVLSRQCVTDLHRQKLDRFHDAEPPDDGMKRLMDEWILRGAGPDPSNFQQFTLKQRGIIFHFDPYRVGSRVEGKYLVFIPSHQLSSVISRHASSIMGWTRDP